MDDNNLEIQASSVTLGNTAEGGSIGAMKGLGLSAVDKDRYTETVINNAKKFEEIIERELPEAKTGVSVLASSVNPESLKEHIRSIDYPYLIKWAPGFLKEKYDKVTNEGSKGLGAGVAVGAELAYALLQSNSDINQINSTVEASKYIDTDPVRIRTCMETLSFEDSLARIKYINSLIEGQGKNVQWVIEPNKKIGDGTFLDFFSRFDQIKRFNSTLTFGMDLDLGGLPKENRHMLLILNRLAQDKRLPVFISLSGKDYQNGDVRSHLPLGDNWTDNQMLGNFYRVLKARGLPLPGLVVETSPVQENVLKDIEKFSVDFAKGYRGSTVQTPTFGTWSS